MVPLMLGTFGTSTPAFTIPSLTIYGEQDQVLGPTLVAAIPTMFATCASPRYLLELANAGHYLAGDGCSHVDCNASLLTPDEAHDVVRRWAVPFFMVELAGDQSYAPFLAPPVPSAFTAPNLEAVVYTAKP